MAGILLIGFIYLMGFLLFLQASRYYILFLQGFMFIASIDWRITNCEEYKQELLNDSGLFNALPL